MSKSLSRALRGLSSTERWRDGPLVSDGSAARERNPKIVTTSSPEHDRSTTDACRGNLRKRERSCGEGRFLLILPSRETRGFHRAGRNGSFADRQRESAVVRWTWRWSASARRGPNFGLFEKVKKNVDFLLVLIWSRFLSFCFSAGLDLVVFFSWDC